jgi:hypothetical protein
VTRNTATASLDQDSAVFVAGQKPQCTPVWVPSNRVMVWAFMAFGVVLRLRQYLFDRSLWNDETLLVMNVLHLSPVELLKPLRDYQTAPIGFLWLEKLSVHLLGSSEMALRLVPLLCGIGSLFLFLAVARRFLHAPTVPVAVGLFAISDPVVYYASEVKQYSGDVAVTLLLYLLTESLFDAHPARARVIVATLAGCVAIWFSFPAVFVLAGIGLAAFWIAAKKSIGRSMLLLSVPAVLWFGSFLLYYVASLRDSVRINHDLMTYWRDAFAPFPPRSVSDVLWYKRSFFDVFSFPGGLTFVGIAAIALILGANELRRRDQGKFLSLLLPIVVVLLASALHRYPFQGRLILFLVPSLFLFVALGFQTIKGKTAEIPALAPLLIAFLFLDPMFAAVRNFVRPPGFEEVRSAIDYIETHRSPGDILYCYYSAELPLQYYREGGRIAPIKQITSVASREDWQRYIDDMNKLRGQKRVWILFSHVWRSAGVDEQAFFVSHLGRIGRKLDSMQATGASAYLYDLSDGGNDRVDR